MLARLATGVVVVVAAQVGVGAARSAGRIDIDRAFAELPAMVGGPYGAGIALRIAGAVLVLAGLPLLRRTLRRAATIPIAGGAVDVLPPLPRAQADQLPSARQRWRAAAVSVVGALLLVASFALIGHAATAQARAVASVATAAHVLAGGIWAGGLLALSRTLFHRHRAGVPRQAGLMAVRFSVLATVGVLLAGAAGVALAAMRLDSVAALWTTAYGVALSAKVGVVLVVIGIGAYNHFVVVPVLRRNPDHSVVNRLRRLGLVEVALLSVVVALTSVLVSLGS
jgi:copper transport protein